MNILFVTQGFYPDTVAVSQVLTDLSIYLKKKGNNISVFTSKYSYENKNIKYSAFENYNDIKIHRLYQTRFGKSNSVFRIFDFLSFNFVIFFKILFLNKKNYDFILGTTFPPLLAFLTLLVCKIKNIPFYYWVMDLQPELSIASGLIKEKSITSNVLTYIGDYSIKNSDKIFSLDKYMSHYLKSRGAVSKKIFTIPLWPIVDKVFKGDRLSNPFRIKHNFGNKIVIMYSGNHAYVHPLDTLLNTAKILEKDERFLFVFIGGGVRVKDVTNFKLNNKLENIIQLPFQPRENIHISLGSSDIQVVVLGDGQVGFTHPNKIYGALFLGKPIVYIGPKKSHIGDILKNIDGNILIEHGNHNKLAKQIVEFFNLKTETQTSLTSLNSNYAKQNLNSEILMDRMYDNIIN